MTTVNNDTCEEFSFEAEVGSDQTSSTWFFESSLVVPARAGLHPGHESVCGWVWNRRRGMQRSMPTAGPEETVVWFTPDVRVLFIVVVFLCLPASTRVSLLRRPTQLKS